MKKIKKIAQSIGVLGKILNSKSISQENTYSCDYINKLYEYSTEEHIVGTWFGKPLYRRMVDFGQLPSNTSLDIQHNIQNVQHIHVNLGETLWCPNSQTYTEQGNCFTGVFIDFISGIYANQNTMSVTTISSDASSFKMLVCLEYTKTTD